MFPAFGKYKCLILVSRGLLKLEELGRSGTANGPYNETMINGKMSDVVKDVLFRFYKSIKEVKKMGCLW